MALLTPDLGFIFWHTIILFVSILLLSKYAWKPILQAIKQREEAYEKAIEQMREARKEVKEVEVKKGAILKEAHAESDRIIKQAITSKEALLEEAEEDALKAKQRMLDNAMHLIELEKQATAAAIKKQTVALVIHTTEKLISKELTQDPAQQKLIQKMITEVEATQTPSLSG